MILKQGSRGPKVKEVQEKLGLQPDGIFGSRTKAAVELFQKQKGLKADGIVGNMTAHHMGIVLETLDTDSSYYNQFSSSGLIIKKAYLDKNEYHYANLNIKPKRFLILHHTAGGPNPYAVIRDWNNDNRGRIATQFVIGGKGINGDETFDGEVVECMPDFSWASHIGKNGSSALHPQSVGIELCNWGPLNQRRDGTIVNYMGMIIPMDQVYDFKTSPFRGYRYYHKYTDKQIENLGLLIQEISKRHPHINLNAGLKEWLKVMPPGKAFEWQEDAYFGRYSGVFTHTNIRKAPEKFDCSPQQSLVDLLKRI